MNEDLRKVVRLIADPVIFGNFFISLCAASLALETYLILEMPLKFDGLIFFIFFATLALYNFHRLMGVRRIKPEDRGEITGWAAKHQFTLLMLIIIGIGGMGFFFFQLPASVGLIFIPLGAVAVFYEIPLVKHGKRFERLRNLWFSKAFLITLVWSVTTALLPALNAGLYWLDFRIWIVLIERAIFIFILALCFDARDVVFDARDGVKTIPVVYGQEATVRLYRILSGAFVFVSLSHLLLLYWLPWIAAAMLGSIGLTFYAVSKTAPRKSDYYYMYIVDGMMIVQFLLIAVMSLL